MSRIEHWDRDRYAYERDQGPFGGDRRERVESHDHHYRGPVGSRIRDHSDERHDRRPRAYDDDYVRAPRQYHDEPRYVERRAPPPPQPPAPYPERDFVHEDRRQREVVREISPPPPPRRPGFLRRQSSLDTFDRRPRHFYEREEYGPPARIPRQEYRPDPYTPIPLPRTKALPPHRMDDRPRDDIRIAEPDYYGDEDYRPYPERERVPERMPERMPERERVLEKEFVRTRRRDRSRDTMTSRPYTKTSRSSSTSSRSSSRSRTTVRSQYPKKGKTKIPSRLVSKRALIDLGYPFVEEGNNVIVLKALGQENIDELLRVSDEYKKSELEVAAARSSAGNVEDRREEVYTIPPPPPATVTTAPAAAPVVVSAAPPAQQPAEVEVVKRETVFRDPSPSRYSSTTGYTGYTGTTTTGTGTTYTGFPAGPVVIRGRSRSRHGRKEIRSEIRALEAELYDRKHRHGDLVKAERTPDGALVMYEEQVEHVDEGHRGPRIEKDRKGPPPGLMNLMLKTLT